LKPERSNLFYLPNKDFNHFFDIGADIFKLDANALASCVGNFPLDLERIIETIQAKCHDYLITHN
jgi:hypothetical protein